MIRFVIAVFLVALGLAWLIGVTASKDGPHDSAVIAVSCPGSEPMLLENWEMHEGRITTKIDETFIVVPDNCWLFVMKGDKRKVASK